MIVRGDDAGSCASANAAIAEAADAGVLRNVSIMACGPFFDEAVALFAARTDLCLGLHITLNAEWERVKWGPLLPRERVPSLIDSDGFFWPTPAEARDRGARVDAMLAEIEAQLARCRDAGLPIAYVDEHMGVSWPWPDLRAAITALCVRENLVDAKTIAPEIEVKVTHPGRDADDMRAFTLPGQEPGIIARERDADRLLLVDPAFRETLVANGIELIRYSEAR